MTGIFGKALIIRLEAQSSKRLLMTFRTSEQINTLSSRALSLAVVSAFAAEVDRSFTAVSHTYDNIGGHVHVLENECAPWTWVMV
jgi:hypothetical protein